MSNVQEQVPVGACQFRAGPIEFSEGGEDGTTVLSLKARSGQPIEHWYWGKIAHDLSGMHVHKPTLPVDYCHRDDEVIGFLDTFDVESGDLVTTGRLVHYKDGDRAHEVRHKAKAGVPYEASIFFDGGSARLQRVDKNETAEVNGQHFDGPGVIVRKWTLRGVAVCPYGMDMHTQTTLSRDETVTVTFEESEQMTKKTDDQAASTGDSAIADDAAVDTKQATKGAPEDTTEPADSAAPDPEVLASQAANSDASEICKKYVDAFGPRGGEWLAEGLSFDEAQEWHTAELKAENEQLRQKLAAVDRGEDEPAEFSTGAEEPDAGKASQAVVDNHGDTLAPLVAFNASKLPGRN